MRYFRFKALTSDSPLLAILLSFTILIYFTIPLYADETGGSLFDSDDAFFSDDLNTLIQEEGESSEKTDGAASQNMSFYVDNGDGTVTAILTGLMWQKGDTHNDVKRDWKASLHYCNQLKLAGHSDWRMPTRNELQSLVSPMQVNPAIDQKIFNHCKSDWYWLDSGDEKNDENADFIHFYNAREGSTHQDASACIRCVRSNSNATE